MRIAYVSHTSAVGGAEYSLLGMIDIARAAHSVVLLCPAGELADRAEALGIDVVTIPPTAFGSFTGVRGGLVAILRAVRSLWMLRRFFVDQRIDLVHANSPRAALLAMARPRGVRLLTHYRDLVDSRLFDRFAHPIVARTTDQQVAISSAVAREVSRRRSRHDVLVLHNFVRDAADPEFADEHIDSARSIRAELGIGTERRIVSYVAQLTPWKNQRVAITALSMMSEAERAVLLLVGGIIDVSDASRSSNEFYLRELERLVSSLGLDDFVYFLGHRDDVANIMTQSDVVALLSDAEPFGRVVIEAMALSKVVVATSHGGPAEIVRHGVDGFLVDPHDTRQVAAVIKEACQMDIRDRAEITARARHTFTSRFSAAPFASALNQMYESMGGTRHVD